MGFVAIVDIYKGDNVYPDGWPKTCQEYETFEKASEAQPGKLIMSIYDYNLYQRGLSMAHLVLTKAIKPVKLWWQFWK